MTTPVPSVFEARCNGAFEALMWALSRPGCVRDVPSPGGMSAMLAIMDTLVDRECAVHCASPDLVQHAERLGATVVPLEEADHVFLPEAPAPEVLARFEMGTDLYPEGGATLVVAGSIGAGTPLRLAGPGVDGTLECVLGPMLPEFWRSRAQVMRYPMGFDLFIVDGTRLIGLPRTTSVEVI